MRIHQAMLCTIALAVAAPAAARAPTDAAIKKAIIAESIAAYPGNCPCPYNTDARGHSCGRRSAYSRPGGASPKCYPEDVSKEEVDEYRREHGG